MYDIMCQYFRYNPDERVNFSDVIALLKPEENTATTTTTALEVSLQI